jgi:hypothetical protein
MVLMLRFGLWMGLGLLPMVSRAQVGLAVPADTVGRRPNIPRLARNRFVVQYDSRYSIINHHLTTINGLKLGIEFRNRFRTGAAIYFLSTGVPTRQTNPANAAEDADAELRFRYLAAYAGYVLLENTRWELSANLQLGMGSAYVHYENIEGEFDKTPREFMGVAEPAVAAQYRVFRWGGFGTGAGWRQPFFVPKTVQKELNGPVFYLRANLFLGELIKVVKDREPLFTQANMQAD